MEYLIEENDVLTDVKLILFRPSVSFGISLLLLCFTLWQIGSLVVNLVSLKHVMASSAVGKVETKAKSQWHAHSVNVSLFGDYVPKDLMGEGIKQSMLDLKVVGILFSLQEKASHVIIQWPGGGERMVKVGDALPGGTVVKRITREGVLIERSGELERLKLPKESLTFEAPEPPLKSLNEE